MQSEWQLYWMAPSVITICFLLTATVDPVSVAHKCLLNAEGESENFCQARKETGVQQSKAPIVNKIS